MEEVDTKAKMPKIRILVIDNYDSFVYNLVRYLNELDYETCIYRNDDLTIEDIESIRPSHILLSPGPKAPIDAGICLAVIERFKKDIPILGICLGHQAIGQALGALVCKAQVPMHGKASLVHLVQQQLEDKKQVDNQNSYSVLFKGLQSPIQVGRYHSLIVSLPKVSTNERTRGVTRSILNEEQFLSAPFRVTALSEENEIMALESHELGLYGVQFHPESILSEHGHQILKNFIEGTNKH